MSSNKIRAIFTVAAFIVGAGFNVCGAEEARVGPSVDFSHGDLKVSENKRFIVHSDGTPFFYLGGTAWGMMHVRNLIESRPFISRVPDQSLIAGDPGGGAEHIRGTRGEDYAFIYLPYGQSVKAALGKISGVQVKAWSFDPRTGQAQLIGQFENKGTHEFDPPGEKNRGNDWVLVLDDASKQFHKAGSR